MTPSNQDKMFRVKFSTIENGDIVIELHAKSAEEAVTVVDKCVKAMKMNLKFPYTYKVKESEEDLQK